MKRIGILFSVLLIIMSFSSCSKDDANYYIKYEVLISSRDETSDVYADNCFEIMTDKGVQMVSNKQKAWTSEVYGPFKKRFTANIKATSYYHGDMVASIFVCRGEEPFVRKAQQTASNKAYGVSYTMSCDASYTIDF